MRKFPHTPFATPLSGSAKETELRILSISQWNKKRPPLWAMLLIALVILTCGSLVSCHPVQPISDPGSSSLPESSASSIPEDMQIVELSLDGLTLDEFGTEDDSLYVRSDPFDACQLTLTVQLGSGKTLEKTWDASHWVPEVFTAPLIHTERDAIVLDCAIFGSNYGAAVILVVEVVDGELVERYASDHASDRNFISYCTAEERGEGLTSVLRIPCLVDKWHGPEYYTLTWNGDTFTAVGDGYFTDSWFTSIGDGRTLTLLGRGVQREGNPALCYEQIQVFSGETLLHTITPDFNVDSRAFVFDAATWDQLLDPHSICDPLVFTADSFHAVDIRDINFDGSDDLGIPIDTTRNDVHCWFLWDAASQQYRYAFSLAGDLTILSHAEMPAEKEMLVETRWDDTFSFTQSRTYQFNSRSQLVWIADSARYSDPAATLQAVLGGETAFWDVDSQQLLDIPTIRLAFTPEDIPLNTTHFAVVDLDGDGQQEIVLEVAAQQTPGVGGFVILREQQGTVFGYPLWYRAFNAIKADGTFSFSSSAFSSGFGRLRFQEHGAATDRIAYSDVASDDPGQILYYMEGSPISESAFDAAIAQQSSKSDAVWHPFTQANIEKLPELMS